VKCVEFSTECRHGIAQLAPRRLERHDVAYFCFGHPGHRGEVQPRLFEAAHLAVRDCACPLVGVMTNDLPRP
jgi:hypothetical protein